MAERLMARVFDVERAEKGSPLQSKINQFTKGKNITAVHNLLVVPNGSSTKAVLTYTVNEDENAPASPRIYAKVIEGHPLDSKLQTAVNSFSKDKALNVLEVASVAAGDAATLVILHTKEGDDGDE